MEKKTERTAPWSRLRSPVVTLAGLSGTGGLIWLSWTDFPLIGLVPLLGLVIVAAVLFSRSDKPSKRLERLIKVLRQGR